MKQNQKAGLVGGILSLSFFVYNIYVVILNSKRIPFHESLLREIMIAIIPQIPLLAPAIVLIWCKYQKQNFNWVFWLYPVIISIGLLNVLLSKGPLGAGLPMILFVFPFCIIYAIVLFILREKSSIKK